MFDQTDCEILANRFTLPELRKELRRAETHYSVASYLDDDNQETSFFEEYIEVVKIAIKLNQSQQPKITSHGKTLDVTAIKTRSDIVSIAERYTTLKQS